MNKFDFNNRTALITGGAQGFGLDIAKKFISFGANVIIWDINEEQLQVASKEINSSKLSYQKVDVSNFEQVKKTAADIISLGKIDNKDLYSPLPGDRYFFSNGWHIKGVYALIIGFIFSASTIWNLNLNFLQSYSWLIGAFIGFFMHYLLSEK